MNDIQAGAVVLLDLWKDRQKVSYRLSIESVDLLAWESEPWFQEATDSIKTKDGRKDYPPNLWAQWMKVCKVGK